MPELRAPVRVAVVGAGYFGRFHVDAWARIPQARLVAVCDAEPARARAALAEAGADAPVFDDAEAMAEAVGPDLVDVTTPPATHLALLRRLAPRVGWLICQKPFCDGLAGAEAALALAAATGARIAVHENIRFQPWNAEAKRLIEAGVLGPVRQVAFRLRPGDGRGPDAYLDRQPYFRTMPRFLVHETAVHWIDAFRFLLGEVSGVFARLTRGNPVIAGEDAGLILFAFEGGARALFDGDRLADHAATDRRRTLGEMLIEGEAATLRLDGEGRLWLRPFGDAAETRHHFAWEDRHFGGDCVRLCAEAILTDWLDGRESPMEAGRYVRNQRIEAAIYDSAERGVWVATPPDDAAPPPL